MHYDAPRFYAACALYARPMERFKLLSYGSYAISALVSVVVLTAGYLTFGVCARARARVRVFVCVCVCVCARAISLSLSRCKSILTRDFAHKHTHALTQVTTIHWFLESLHSYSNGSLYLYIRTPTVPSPCERWYLCVYVYVCVCVCGMYVFAHAPAGSTSKPVILESYASTDSFALIARAAIFVSLLSRSVSVSVCVCVCVCVCVPLCLCLCLRLCLG